MPELPEVQTVVNDLQILVGETIIDFVSLWPKALKNEHGSILAEKDFAKLIIGKKIQSVLRHGKNIVIHLSGSTTLIAHLRMTGQLVLRHDTKKHGGVFEEKYQKHTHHHFVLQKNKRLIFIDIRKFGTLQLLPTEQLPHVFKTLGIDPFDKDFTLKTFRKLFQRRYSKSVKEFLMDQAIILGIGNIYASEILFDASVNPKRKISSITEDEQKEIYHAIRKILQLAIKLRGTSVSDYRDASGKKGGFQNMLKVYKKHGQPCKMCGTMIERTILGQRSTFFCPTCQN